MKENLLFMLLSPGVVRALWEGVFWIAGGSSCLPYTWGGKNSNCHIPRTITRHLDKRQKIWIIVFLKYENGSWWGSTYVVKVAYVALSL